MKRPPGLWLLLSAGVLWLCFQDVSCVRATSLIFGKSTTTTTTTTTAAPGNEAADQEGVTEVPEAINATNATKLTGIPQVDYVLDPNLPRELNGHNLTDYPFYDRLPPPEEFDFKCDGLHDGFYASVPHQCQVYHHCLYGTRYDFLCANYTAFDQKTFICHFASEVDCANSKKFWHRNDALYKATTTTTVKPIIIYAPPPPSPVLTGGAPRRPPPSGAPGGGRRRKPPTRRRRPYDYYDDYEEEDEYYEEPRYTATESPRGRRKRPRPRPRPVYEDEYEEYEDERYDRRRTSARRGEDERRPYDNRRTRPPSRRNKEDRRKYDEEYDEELEDEDPRFDRSEERKNKRTKPERKPEERDEERRNNERDRDRRPEDREKDRRTDDKERKVDDRDTERRTEERKEKRPTDDRRYEKRRQEDVDDDRRHRNRKGSRKPVQEDEYEDDIIEEKPPTRKVTPEKDEKREEAATEEKPLKPVGSLFDRPRAPPRIRPPVPKSEADKYSFKTTTIKSSKVADEEYYDDYEDEPPPKRQRPLKTDTLEPRKPLKPRDETRESRKPLASRPRGAAPRKPVSEEYEEYEDEKPKRTTKPKNEGRRVGSGSRKRPAFEEYDDYEDSLKRSTTSTTSRNPFYKDRKNKEAPRTTTTTTTTTTPTTTTTNTEAPAPKEEPIKQTVRVVKRPFLPSRGGNPYLARGLQPLGLKAEIITPKESDDKPTEAPIKEAPPPADRQNFKTSAILSKTPIRARYQSEDDDDEFRPASNRPVHINRYKSIQEFDSRTTPKPKVIEKNPLDINENEYDVTLNDALNPTLPNLPVRSFPTGFSPATDYTYSSFHRPRYVVDATINQASSEYNYRYKQPQQRYEIAQQGRVERDYPTSNNGEQIFRPSQRVTYYTTY